MTDISKYGPWAVIAGGSEGAGAEFAKQLAADGFNLVLIARKPGPLVFFSFVTLDNPEARLAGASWGSRIHSAGDPVVHHAGLSQAHNADDRDERTWLIRRVGSGG
jgi:NAD(P)-dependent dehydrogenase (short-subunit alcohol dehydrogenase family)